MIGRIFVPFAIRDFRAPHHTISDVGLLGACVIPVPAEEGLAHHGVLFIDELPKLKRSTLDVMRHLLEAGRSRSLVRRARSLFHPNSCWWRR